jgi:signal transduction histidine kinase
MTTSQSGPNSFLAGLSALATRDFLSIQTAIDAVLHLMVERLNLRSSFLAQVADQNSRLEVLASYNLPGGCDIQIGVSVPLAQDFAAMMARTQEQLPLLIGRLRSLEGEKTQEDKVTSTRIGRYMGVPIILSDGTVFGVLAAADPEPQAVNLAQAEVLVLLAQRLVGEIERHLEQNKLKLAHDNLAKALEHVNRQLEQMDRMKTNFVATISHEFRTALTGIQGFSEVMRDEDFTLQEMKEFAANIHQDAQRMTRMITDLLDLDRLEAGVTPLKNEKLDLRAIIKPVAELVRQQTTHHRFRYAFDDPLPAISGDADKLTQVFTNLITNAVKYAPGGEIVLSVHRQGEYVQVKIQDHGIGIQEHLLEQIFERHSHIDASRSRYIKGAGLGLPIVRQIIQMHGGKVWAESVYGDGATFHVALPVVDAPKEE